MKYYTIKKSQEKGIIYCSGDGNDAIEIEYSYMSEEHVTSFRHYLGDDDINHALYCCNKLLMGFEKFKSYKFPKSYQGNYQFYKKFVDRQCEKAKELIKYSDKAIKLTFPKHPTMLIAEVARELELVFDDKAIHNIMSIVLNKTVKQRIKYTQVYSELFLKSIIDSFDDLTIHNDSKKNIENKNLNDSIEMTYIFVKAI